MIGTVLVAAALAASASAPADAREAYMRRQFLLEADQKCHLLSARERAALAGSAQQARGAILRAGLRPGPIARAAADRAASTLCSDEALGAEAATARAAFSQWAALPRQEFAGEHQSWQASRHGAEGMLTWTLWQDLPDGFRIGLAEDAEQRAAMVAMPIAANGRRPRAVALEFRDSAKWADFVDPTLGGLFAAGDGEALGRNATPAALCKRVWAAGGLDSAVQAPGGQGEYLIWALPQDTLHQMAALDPRDVARLSVEYSDTNVRTFYVEVGDLAAALGFLAAGETPSTRPAPVAPLRPVQTAASDGGHH